MRFIDALTKRKNEQRNIVIPDIKRFSPKEGGLLLGRDPVEEAVRLVRAGAPVLSVVTEEKEFHGSLQMLESICAAVDVPVLRKDFIRTKEDLIKTKEAGAAAVLLICSMLEKDQLTYLYETAVGLGLDPLVETHSEAEMEAARSLGACLIGINNRNILKLERDGGDVSLTRLLAGKAPKNAFLVSESAILTGEDVRAAVKAGADAALVGTAIWKAEDPAAFYQSLARKISVKICGIMDAAGVSACMRAGADMLGFVVDYPVFVPWNIPEKQAKELLPLVKWGYRTCVVTGGQPEKILALAKRLMPHAVQLHYKETLEETSHIARVLKETGIKTIKTIPMERLERIHQFGTEDLEQIVCMLNQTDVSALLVDARGPSNAAHSSETAPAEAFKTVKALSQKRVILAGGLHAGNIRQTLAETGAEHIDIMSGVEIAPGQKSEKKLNDFFSQM